MDFVSTRGGDKVSAAEAVLRGIAEGGGLYVPESFPQISASEREEMLSMSYPERAAHILAKFFDVDREELLAEMQDACEKFEGEDPVPLVKIEDGLFILELFHGPTCAYADLGMAVLPYLFEKSQEALGRKEKLLLVTATSGDDGKAIMETFRGRENFRAAVFYPEEGVSKMQRLQLTTQEGDNLDSIAVRGTFDECQAGVKKFLRSEENRDKLMENGIALSTASSINVGKLLPMTACYFSAYLDLVSSGEIEDGKAVDVSVPAGNFAGLLAAYYAKEMGLPLGTLVCASNRNNTLSEFFSRGVFDRKRPFYRTMSPCLDVQSACNIERLVFELTGRDAALTVERMKSLAGTGRFTLRPEEMKKLECFFGGYASEEDTVECVYEFFEEFNYPLDTHTGVAVHVARLYSRKRGEDLNAEPRPMIVAATDSPYKFPQAVYYALTGNDVKDSFKGLKRIHLLSAMEVPEALKSLRYKPARFKTVIGTDKIAETSLSFALS